MVARILWLLVALLIGPRISVAQDTRDTASKLRFDLDLPSAAHDDIPLQSGILLPEWDWKKQQIGRAHV